jgi:hypothetical protein
VVTGWTRENEVLVKGMLHTQKKNSNTVKIKNRERGFNPYNIVVQGCHGGICSDDSISFSGSTWIFGCESRPSDGGYLHTFTNESVKVIGYNPVRKRFLVQILGRNQYAAPYWISESTLFAAKSGNAIGNAVWGEYPGDQSTDQLRPGDTVISSYGFIFKVEDTHISNDRYSRNDPSEYAKVGCFHGYCTGQVLKLWISDAQVVLGFNAGKDQFLVDTSSTVLPSSAQISKNGLRWIKRDEMTRLSK